MIEFKDWDGDYILGVRRGDLYVLTDDVRGTVTPFARITPDMARALAADLLAFADSEPATETETT